MKRSRSTSCDNSDRSKVFHLEQTCRNLIEGELDTVKDGIIKSLTNKSNASRENASLRHMARQYEKMRAENADLKRQVAAANKKRAVAADEEAKEKKKDSDKSEEIKKENDELKKELELLKVRLSASAAVSKSSNNKSSSSSSSPASPASSRSSDTGSDQQDVKSLNIDRSSPDGQEFDLENASTSSSASSCTAAAANSTPVQSAPTKEIAEVSADESDLLKELRREVDELKEKLAAAERIELKADEEAPKQEAAPAPLPPDVEAKVKDLEESLEMMKGEFENMEDYWQVRSNVHGPKIV